ncbi:MAG: carboxypeptidase regulatory-like domain-containing protein [Gemmatimonadetes bacterium]|nr:carboxypeptidase regulatory-like domain-containing protein [Gemmatimonadota bacterium]
MSLRTRLAALAFVLIAPAAVNAQRVRGVVIESDGTTPAAHVALLLVDSAGALTARGQTGGSGSFELVAPAPGSYRLRALRVGFAPTVSELLVLGPEEVRTVRITLAGQRVTLPAVQVTDRAACGSTRGTGGTLLDVWDQARAALQGASQARGDGIAATTRVAWMRSQPLLNDSAAQTWFDQPRESSVEAFRSRSAGELVREGFMTSAGDSVEFHAPDAQVLLDPEFAAWYCFGLVAPPEDHRDWLGLSLRAQGAVEGRVTIEGTLWLTRAGALQHFEYRYAGMDKVYDDAEPGGRVDFMQLPTGQWIVSRWMLRMGEALTEVRRQSVGRNESRWRRTRLVRIVERGAWVSRVQLADGQFVEPNRSVVRLMLAAPDQGVEQLAGTDVSIPEDAFTAQASETGSVLLEAIGPGQHRVLLRTPLMRDLGLAPETTSVALLPSVLELRLPVPTLATLRQRICPANPRDAVAAGLLPAGTAGPLVVRRAQDATGAGVPVVVDSAGRWHACGLSRNVSYLLAGGTNTAAATRFRIPRTVDLALVGVRGGPSLDVAATLAPAPTIEGDGARLVVRAFAARDSSPLLDAQAVLDDSLLVRPAANGDLRYRALAPGDHLLTVRRLGHSPSIQTVTVALGEPLEMQVYLERLPQLMSEVVVRGRTLRVPTKFVDVLRRTASGWGMVFSREDFQNATDVKNVLWRVPGVRASDNGITFQRCAGELPGNLLAQAQGGEAVTSTTASTVGDTPSTSKVQVYIDGVRVTAMAPDRGSDPITTALKMVPVRDIEFMEVYRGTAQIPVEFVNDACAVIAIWTRAY